MAGRTLGELAKHVGGRIKGDAGTVIEAVSTIDKAGTGEITFLSNKKYEPQLKTTRASAVIVAKEVETDAALLIAEDTYYAFMQIMVLIYGHRKHKDTGTSKQASISKTAKIGKNCSIYDFTAIGDNVIIGKNCVVYPGVFIGPDVTIGDDCVLYPHAVIYNGCQIGNRVIIHANATVGEDGYGFATHKGIHHKIPQVGIVILEDDVEIGAGAAIERATIGKTIIKQGAKIGDMVAIGHGTVVGPHCLLVAQVGVAGSVTLGHHCVLGGQVGVAGHLKIGDMVQIGAQSGVPNSVPDGKIVLGAPAVEANHMKRVYATMQQLPEMRKKIRALEKQLDELKKTQKSK